MRERVLARIRETIDRGDFTNGQAVSDFERQFAEHSGHRHCVGLSSGLDALRLFLLASGLAQEDGVIVPASTFAATFEAVLQAGGRPIVVDVGDEDYNLDLAQTEAAATAASHVMPVHLYGQMADMRGLSRVAEVTGLQIVEDACQAHGSQRDGVSPGELARAAAFSFYPSKNLGAFGDAGALVTDDGELASRVRALRVHGETSKYHHEFIGYTARLDTIQAIVLLEKLPLLEEWNGQRRAAARFYAEALAGIDDLRLPPEPKGSESVWHLYVVRTSNPEGSRHISPTSASRPGATIRSRRTFRLPIAILGFPPATSRWRRLSPGRGSRSRSIPESPRRSSNPSVRRSASTSEVARPPELGRRGLPQRWK